MGCLHNQTELGRTIMASGEFHVSRRCKLCLKNVTASGQWIPKKQLAGFVDDFEALPIFADYRSNNPPCYICGAIGTEEHHFAPKELFPETFEKWPKAYLCKLHHREWHNKITIPLRTLRNRERKSKDGKSNAPISPEIP